MSQRPVTQRPEVLLERAREHCFLAGIGDVGEQLCAANMPYGIAKIHWVQAQLGLPPDATFVGAPDATVTRNVSRWNQGFGYGGRIRWTGDLAVLDIKSNGCGMLVGALPGLPDAAALAERARSVLRDGLELEGIPIAYDLHEGNHFLDLIETRSAAPGEAEPSPAYFVMHSSGHEHRESSPFGVGIYWDACDALRERAEVFETPWGSLHVLRDEEARSFFDSYMKVQAWNERRRAVIADALFDEWSTVVNATHQGMTRVNDCHLGCYVFDDALLSQGVRFPLTIAADLPIYFVKPTPNLTEQVADRAGFLERARRHGVADRILGANLLPHGGGYRYPHIERVGRVLDEGGDRRRFELHQKGGGTLVLENPRAEAYGYRGLEILDRVRALELGELVLQAEVRYVVRD